MLTIVFSILNIAVIKILHHPKQQPARFKVSVVGDQGVCHQAMNDSIQAVLQIAGGIKMSPIYEGMLRGKNRVGGIWPHNPRSVLID